MASVNFDKPKCDKCHKFTANGGVKCDVCEANYHWGCAKAKNLLNEREKLTCCLEEDDGESIMEDDREIEDEGHEGNTVLSRIAKTVGVIKKNQVTKNIIKDLIREAVQQETMVLREEIAELKREIIAMRDEN